MNNLALQGFTPRVRKFTYDILESNIGCQSVLGSRVADVLPVTEVCVSEHSTTSPIFNKPETASYSFGPYTLGVADLPYVTKWAVWMASAGIRAGQLSLVVPPESVRGGASTLYSTLSPATAHVSHAFGATGLLAVAIHKADGVIEIKRYTSATEATASITFLGAQPALWFTGTHYRTASSSGQLVCFYLRPELPGNLYVRIESEGFATEHALNVELPISLSKLLHIETSGMRMILYAIDELGRDVELKTAQYAVEESGDSALMSAGFLTGFIFKTGISASAGQDSGLVSCSMLSGVIHKSLIDVGTLPDTDQASISVTMIEGEIL